MVSSGMLRRMALVRTDVSGELSASIRVTIGELGTTLATASVVPSSPIVVILMKEALSSSETSVLQEPESVSSQKTPFFVPCIVCVTLLVAF
jgi:ABC-type taurine transport system substrate-binding protein